MDLPEGPLLLPDRSWLVTEMAASRGHVTQVSADGQTSRVVARTGRPNGLCRDRDGAIWVAESQQAALLRLTLRDGWSRILTECEGVRFLWPNDLCIGPDGAVYLTDSGIAVDALIRGGAIAPNYRTLPYDGKLVRFDPATGVASSLDDGLLFANGIAFGPDGMLYISESVTGNVYRYAEWSRRAAARRELFANVLDPDDLVDSWHGPDGMAFSADGRLWVTVFGQGHVAVVDHQGSVVDRLRLEGRLPTNVAFGPAGQRLLFVVETELGRMEAHEVGVDGLELHA